MKVLFVEHFLPGSVYTLELGKELSSFCDITVLCKKTTTIPEQDYGIHLMPYLYPGNAGKVRGILEYGQTLLKMTRTIQTGKFDILHIQSLKLESVEIKLYKALRRYYGKLVHTVHNVLPHEYKEADVRAYAEWYKACDALIVHNEASKRLLIELFAVPEEKISIVAHGAYQTYDTSAARTVRDDKRHYLLFGRIRPYKGVDILLHAVAKLDSDIRKKIHITIIGRQYPKIDSTDYGQMVKDLGCDDCVTFKAERVDDKDVPTLFANHDIGVFPYRNIYGSGSLLMSYTFGMPVIASDILTFKEECDYGRTGILFQSESADDLARAITESVSWSNEQMEQYRVAIRELVESKYNWKISAKKTFDVYNQ